MGELLRRYWHPVAGAAEFARQSVQAVRVLGEDLTLYRDKSGNYGLVDRHCPHRRVMNQDFIAWVGQGVIADRTKEHLGESDRGVILMRKRLLEDLAAVAAGHDPKGTIRDPAANHRVRLPIIGGLDRPAASAGPPAFPVLAGQPEEITKEFEQARRNCAAAGPG